ncbi:nucleoid-associated protein [Chitinilyticum piscinae]|uniref:Nucleoid-associated protein n=1 Tax=Chitinilyticum piscinae TaxID=2866724 RepID=A0A8J7FJV6_9NEIS|nr:nucleoid-associated protein [Chitinilyticum piscinae]MBE9610735.1 nucleoid-associated protein [Chitinilyticum piscinae]
MMIEESRVAQLVVHRVGNPARGEPLQLSERAASVDAEVSQLILEGYLKGIVSERKKHQFIHETDLNLNELYHYKQQFFRDEIDFVALSQAIARHLHARSQHPNISAGDLLVILFENLADGERVQRAIGVFKSEIRDDFLTVVESGEVIDLRHATGINPRLIDKGALLLESGPDVFAVDRQAQSAKFWLDDFLQVLRVPDPASTTKLVAEVLEQVSEQIADPKQQQQFKEAVLTRCREEEEFLPWEVTDVAEKFVPREQVSQVLDQAAQSHGFSLEKNTRVPAKNVAKRLERSWSKIGIGHGVSILQPSDLNLEDVNIESGDEEIVMTLYFSKKI